MIKLENVSKQFGAVSALEPLALRIADGELVCLLGPSGSGKSTLLRIIGGFEMPTGGKVLIDGADVARTRSGGATRLREQTCPRLTSRIELDGRSTMRCPRPHSPGGARCRT